MKLSLALVATMAIVLPLASAPVAALVACGGTTVGAGGVYVVVDSASNVWLYLESNGVAGLQRGGAGPAEPVLQALNASPTGNLVTITDADTCQQSANPDTLLF